MFSANNFFFYLPIFFIFAFFSLFSLYLFFPFFSLNREVLYKYETYVGKFCDTQIRASRFVWILLGLSLMQVLKICWKIFYPYLIFSYLLSNYIWKKCLTQQSIQSSNVECWSKTMDYLCWRKHLLGFKLLSCVVFFETFQNKRLSGIS